jgi:hypothetical protein
MGFFLSIFPSFTSRVAVHCFGRKRRQAYSYVFRTAGVGSAVSDPFAGLCNDGLAGLDIKGTGLILNMQFARKDYGDLLKLRPLTGFGPTGRRFHVRDTYMFVPRINTPDKFFNLFGWVSGRLNELRFFYQFGHGG